MDEPIWKIEWHDGMRVGIPEIDEDHKRFISLVNGFNQSVTSRLAMTEIKTRLQLILDDAGQHFAHEERLFKEWQYPDADEHARRHAQIIKALQDIKGESISYGLDSEWIDVGLKIKEVLIEHILKEDMKYAVYYRNSRIADSAV